MTETPQQRMFRILADRTAEAQAKADAVRAALEATDPKALATADALKKNSALASSGYASAQTKSAASNFGTFAARAAKDEL